MLATWTQGTGDEFIEMNKKGWDARASIFSISRARIFADISGNRAIAQTKMHINQRAPVEGVLVDVVCTGRFYDFLEKRDGKWGFILRQPIYEKDRIDPVSPGEAPNSIPSCCEASPKATGIWPICSRRSDFPSKTICRV